MRPDGARRVRRRPLVSGGGRAARSSDCRFRRGRRARRRDVAPRVLPRATVLFGDGAGGFRGSVRLATGGDNYGVALHAGDLDGDGHADIAVGHGTSTSASIFLGNGSGGFAPPTRYSLGFGRWPVDAAAADFDEDSIPDLAFACEQSDTVSILLGTGGGAFASGLGFSTSESPSQVAVADFDLDGHLDFATPGAAGSLITFRFGDGTGLFPARRFLATAGPTNGMATADFDRDGVADLAVSRESAGEIQIFLGDGTGGFEPADVFLTGRCTRLLVADVNRDREPDLLAASGNSIVLLLNDSAAGGFLPPRAFGAGETVFDLAAGDFDGDGRLDVVTANWFAGTVAVLRGDGCGGFPSGGQVPLAENGIDVALADFGGDGALDVALIDSYAGALVAAPGDGTGGFVAPAAVAEGLVDPRGIAAADLDGDHAPDVVAAVAGSEDGAGGGVVLVRGTETGGFEPPAFVGVAGRPWSVEVADMNADGVADVLSANSAGDTVAILLGSGGGVLGAPAHFPAGDGPQALAATDFDEVGALDVAVALQFADGVGWLAGDALGGLGAPVFFPTGNAPARIVAGDWNGDAHADLAVAHLRAGIVVLSGDGAGGFQAAPAIVPGGLVQGLASADLDGDGASDLAVTHPDQSDVTVLVGNGGGGFAVARRFVAPRVPQGLAAGDLDADGREDLVAARLAGVVALRNLTSAATSAVLGNVNAALGPIENVLFVNGVKGSGPERRVTVDPFVLFQIRMKLPSSDLDGSARFALNAWVGDSRISTVTRTPFGTIGLPPACARKTWNNTGDPRFGAPDLPSRPAPSVVIRREGGVRKRGLFFVQGFVEDAASPSGAYAVTNGILIDSR